MTSEYGGKHKMQKIKIEFFNVLYLFMDDKTMPGKITKELGFSEKTTIQELLEISKEICADLSSYYCLSKSLCCNKHYFPYIIKNDGRIIFNQSYNETKVVDFLHTHRIKNEIICAVTGIPQAGGPDLRDFFEMWAQVYPLLDQVGTMMGLFLGVKEFVKWIKCVFKERQLHPQTAFDLLLSRNQWNYIELSVELGLDVDDVKKLLQLSGFKWDRTKMLYIFIGDIEKIREKLSKISIYEHE